MSKFNDIDLKKWKDYDDIDVNSLWIIDKRKKDELNSNNYHGNFVPQIPEHFVKRFTKENDLIIDPFVGSGTTIFESTRNNRFCIGVDINPSLFELVTIKNIDHSLYSLIEGDSRSKNTISKIKNEMFSKYNKEKAQFIIFHPPYHDIIKFSDNKKDLSNCDSIEEFLKKFNTVIKNYKDILEDDRYCALVIGDKYENSEWIPLSFYCMNLFQKMVLS